MKNMNATVTDQKNSTKFQSDVSTRGLPHAVPDSIPPSVITINLITLILCLTLL